MFTVFFFFLVLETFGFSDRGGDPRTPLGAGMEGKGIPRSGNGAGMEEAIGFGDWRRGWSNPSPILPVAIPTPSRFVGPFWGFQLFFHYFLSSTFCVLFPNFSL